MVDTEVIFVVARLELYTSRYLPNKVIIFYPFTSDTPPTFPVNPQPYPPPPSNTLSFLSFQVSELISHMPFSI